MTATATDMRLPSVIRLNERHVFEGELPAADHTRLHLEMLHSRSGGLVEIAAGHRNADGDLILTTRLRADHFLPGGAAGDPNWLDALIALADAHHQEPREGCAVADQELFVGVAERDAPDGHRWHVPRSRWLWVDVDDPCRLPALWAFLNEPTERFPAGRLPHLLVESAGASAPCNGQGPQVPSNGDRPIVLSDGEVIGGVHAYWRLDRPLHAVTVRSSSGETYRDPRISKPDDGDVLIYYDAATGEMFDGEVEVIEHIERANLRLIHALGHRFDEDGRQIPTVADVKCRDRPRLLRLAGTRNGKSGRYSRIIYADRFLAPYNVRDLVGDLPDPVDRPAVHRHRNGGPVSDDDDPFKRISLLEVYEAATGREASGRGRVRCPSRDHEDVHPSCSINEREFCCHACGACGAHYQLVSCAVFGGPTENLRGDAFNAAKGWMQDRYGPL